MRSMRSTALASLSLRARSVFGLLILLPLGLLVGRVTVIGTGRGKLAKLVTDHVFGDIHRNMLLSVVDAKRDADELRQDGRAARPDLDHIVAARAQGLLGLLEHVAVDERPLPNRTGHVLPALLHVTAANDELVRCLVGTRTLALGRLAPRGNRVTATRSTAFTTTMRVVDRVHGHAAVDGLAAEPTVATGLAERGVGVVLVGDGTDGCKASAMHTTLFARVEAKDRPTGVTADILGIGTSRTGDLAALAGLELDIVHDRADR